MPRVYDRVKDTTTTTGTGNVTLSNTPPSGFVSFGSMYTIGESIPYCIAAGAEYETGIGHLVDATTFSRDVVYQSSNNNTFVSFSAGTKDIFVSVLAHIFMNQSIGASYARIRGMDLP